jgi:hypothetical protein
MLLADYAQVSEGKLTIVGGGWSTTGPMPTQSAVAAKIEVPWDQANIRHQIVLELKDQDGHPVQFPGPDGAPRPIRIEAALEVGRPPGVLPGTPLDAPMAVNVGPLPLPPGSRFTWQLSIDGLTDEDWCVSFSTRSLSAVL